jgi:stage II sporulation protein GA (sporulation sigma-E factor processing peptidase)
MKYVVYLDVFFLVNLVMDLILLKLTALYIKPQTTYLRCLSGAICGSILSIIAVALQLRTSIFSLLISYDNMIIHMLFSYVFIVWAMVAITFGRSSIKEMLTRSAVLYIITIFMGGLFNFLYSYTYFGYLLQSIFRGFTSSVNVIWMLGVTFTSYMILNLLHIFWKRIRGGSMMVEVVLILNNQKVSVKGLIDSGNSLTDPYTGKRVHIICVSSVRNLLDGISIYEHNFKLIPFRSLGKNNGLIRAITFDELHIYNADEENMDTKEEIYSEKSPIIGLYEGCLSKNGEYEMLLHKSVKF